MKTFFRVLLLPLFGLLAGPGFADLNVVATTPDLGALARAIGGDEINLTVLAKPTEDPHFVDAKPSFLVKLNHADVLIEGGAELEAGWLTPLLEGARNPRLEAALDEDEGGAELEAGWLTPLLEGARNPRLEAGKPGRVNAAEGVALLEIPSVLDRSQGDIHASGNPHYLTDPLNGRIVAAHLARAFAELAPAHAAKFAAHLQAFTAQLDARMAEWRKLLGPYQGRPVVTYHNYWIYFGARFALPMDLFLEPKPGIPPTPAHLAGVIGRMKAGNLKVITVQPYQNRKTAETVAGHTGAVVLDWPSFPGGPGTEGYLEWMDYLVTSTAKAFAAQP